MPDDKQPSANPEWRDQDGGADAASDRTYHPSTQQVNRMREQGNGVGQTELNTQHDPTRYDSADRVGAGEGSQQDLSPEPGGGANLQDVQAAEAAQDKTPSGDQQ